MKRGGGASGRRFQLGIEIGNNLLEGLNGLLDCRDLHQFPAAHRPIAVLQRDDQIPPLLLELDQRQPWSGNVLIMMVEAPCLIVLDL